MAATLAPPTNAAAFLGHIFRKGSSMVFLQTTTTTKRFLPPIVFATEKKLNGVSIPPVVRRGRNNYATNKNEEGSDFSSSVDSTLIHNMEKKIKEQLDADFVNVKDAYGDGRHVSIDVISSAFEGQSALNRQRMVYKAIWEELQNTVHAVDQMTTRTPLEASR